jgi:ABC-2 type transport system permease protein
VKSIALIIRREIGAYLRSPLGYVVIAVLLLIDGLLFNARAMGSDTKRLSAEVLANFFEYSSGISVTAALFLSMRLLAEERQTGTLTLLFGSPIRDYQIVLGKYLSAFAFLAGMTLITIYMPLLIMVHGRITSGHILAGYLGLLLIGSTALGIGIFASALTKSQMIAILAGAGILVGLILSWMVGTITDRPLNELFTWMSLHNKHFQPFMSGLINTQDIVFYLSATYFFLFLATRVLESRRWSG